MPVSIRSFATVVPPTVLGQLDVPAVPTGWHVAAQRPYRLLLSWTVPGPVHG